MEANTTSKHKKGNNKLHHTDFNQTHISLIHHFQGDMESFWSWTKGADVDVSAAGSQTVLGLILKVACTEIAGWGNGAITLDGCCTCCSCCCCCCCWWWLWFPNTSSLIKEFKNEENVSSLQNPISSSSSLLVPWVLCSPVTNPSALCQFSLLSAASGLWYWSRLGGSLWFSLLSISLTSWLLPISPTREVLGLGFAFGIDFETGALTSGDGLGLGFSGLWVLGSIPWLMSFLLRWVFQ